MTPYRDMALNNAWANATLYAAMSTLDHAAFAAERPGFFPSLLNAPKFRQAVQVNKMIRRCNSQIEHGHQALATGD